MKVLHVFKTARPFTQGGLEEAIRQICLNTPTLGGESLRHEVACVVSGSERKTARPDYATVTGYPARFGPPSCPVAPALLPDLWRAPATYDLLHLHSPWPVPELALWPRPGGRARRVVTYHADVVGRGAAGAVYARLQRAALARCDAVVATSDPYIDSSPVLSRLRRRPRVIPLGLDPDSYPDTDLQRLAHWAARLDRGFCLFLGVLRRYKGLEVLARAAAESRVPVVVVGDGPLRAEVEAAARAIPTLTVLGHLDDADRAVLLQLADAVVLPSTQRAEAFGLALLEGAMAGKALVSTALGTGTDVVNRHGETGLVVPPGDAGALAAALGTLHADPDLAVRFGVAARDRFEARYTGAAMGRAYAALYAELLGDK